MDVVDILVSIVVVTILVTIILAVVTYVAYKLRLSREPARSETAADAPRYFVRYDPPGIAGARAGEGGATAARESSPERDASGMG